MIQYYSLFVLLVAVNQGWAQDDIKIVPMAVENCPVDGSNPISMNLKLEDIGDGKLAFTGDIELEKDFSDEYMVKITLDSYENDMWVENVMTLEDTFCNYLNNQLQKLWTKVREAADPPINEECAVKAGKYKLDRFEADKDDVDGLSQAGHYRGILKVMSPEDENVACLKMEGKLVKE